MERQMEKHRSWDMLAKHADASWHVLCMCGLKRGFMQSSPGGSILSPLNKTLLPISVPNSEAIAYPRVSLDKARIITIDIEPPQFSEDKSHNLNS